MADALPVIGPGHDQALLRVSLEVGNEGRSVLLRHMLADLQAKDPIEAAPKTHVLHKVHFLHKPICKFRSLVRAVESKRLYQTCLIEPLAVVPTSSTEVPYSQGLLETRLPHVAKQPAEKAFVDCPLAKNLPPQKLVGHEGALLVLVVQADRPLACQRFGFLQGQQCLVEVCCVRFKPVPNLAQPEAARNKAFFASGHVACLALHVQVAEGSKREAVPFQSQEVTIQFLPSLNATEHGIACHCLQAMMLVDCQDHDTEEISLDLLQGPFLRGGQKPNPEVLFWRMSHQLNENPRYTHVVRVKFLHAVPQDHCLVQQVEEPGLAVHASDLSKLIQPL
mmetsp:Transcript_30694/g.57465  ORF Transcript_30694/g.57465 Transcript_30694/m.57465 type:complete len:336 (+) Transcript_30694:164-1171(+)